ncbi:MAG: NifU family protein [Actinomycetota bacterium]
MEFDNLLSRLEELLDEVDHLDEPIRDRVFELLDGIDLLHRTALNRLAEHLPEETLSALREDPAITWMLDAYGVAIDEKAAAEAALEEIRPYIESHGGSVEILDASGGIVQVKLAGACSGCTASAVTLTEGIETALRDNFPAFVAMKVEEDDAPSHPPPGPTLLQIKLGPS